jgi:hypothetical protein
VSGGTAFLRKGKLCLSAGRDTASCVAAGQGAVKLGLAMLGVADGRAAGRDWVSGGLLGELGAAGAAAGMAVPDAAAAAAAAAAVPAVGLVVTPGIAEGA